MSTRPVRMGTINKESDPMDQSRDPGTSAPSLRNLQILEAVATGARPMTATEINAGLQLPKPTIHRLVANLEQEGYLSRHLDGRSYLPGPKLRAMMLGVMRAGHHHLPRREVLTRLNEALGETCNLSIPDGDAMIYVDRVETHWPLRIALKVGSRVPLHATSAGKAALAQMSEAALTRFLSKARLTAHTDRTITDPQVLRAEIQRIREQGYSTDEQEFVPGMIAVAVPVLDPSGGFCATLSFHAPVQRLTVEAGLNHLPAMRQAAADLAELI
ncbi:IclR family transcriptional regulator [Paracoccus sp. CPCC 101403]|uniref:IclR family transcriptional regulator n=1 Tax=Paracoccus broussonetiae TaxID=3075834 RepID=A0ABU3EKF0_9RHOB|nr:IclR family transcriptional regulator [Paracoccus sp. CPCC 101403]MDT1064725.1 IclR family transcriptional regulator [Paracoccus sp. CPCC 101403]